MAKRKSVAKNAKPAKKPVEKPAKAAKPEQARYCLCGCGKEVGARSYFRQGHDAKLNKRVKAGEPLPAEAAAVMVACRVCGHLLLRVPADRDDICKKCAAAEEPVKAAPAPDDA